MGALTDWLWTRSYSSAHLWVDLPSEIQTAIPPQWTVFHTAFPDMLSKLAQCDVEFLQMTNIFGCLRTAHGNVESSALHKNKGRVISKSSSCWFLHTSAGLLYKNTQHAVPLPKSTYQWHRNKGWPIFPSPVAPHGSCPSLAEELKDLSKTSHQFDHNTKRTNVM